MNQAGFSSQLHHPWRYFSFILFSTLGVFVFYGANMVIWRNCPDNGWRYKYEASPHLVTEVFSLGKAAGLKINDVIVAINGKQYSSFEEPFFEVRNTQPGAFNVYICFKSPSIHRSTYCEPLGKSEGGRDVQIRVGNQHLVNILCDLLGGQQAVFPVEPFCHSHFKF